MSTLAPLLEKILGSIDQHHRISDVGCRPTLLPISISILHVNGVHKEDTILSGIIKLSNGNVPVETVVFIATLANARGQLIIDPSIVPLMQKGTRIKLTKQQLTLNDINLFHLPTGSTLDLDFQ
ncbi:MAG: hypothetical protein ACR5K7_01735 [Symbiopectobacterium sp.]